MPDDDDDMKITQHADGSYEWTDSSGAKGYVSRSGSQVFNPDGSGTAMDTQGNETTWGADYSGLEDGRSHGTNLQVDDGSKDDSAYGQASDWDNSGDSDSGDADSGDS